MAAKKARKAKAPTAVAPAIDRAAIVLALFEAMHRGVSVREYAAERGVPESTLRQWANDDEFGAQYARAREVQADVDVERAMEVADRAARGEYEDVQAARLLVDTLKWRAAKFRPRRYGDKAELLLTGDPEKPIEVKHRWRFGDQEVEF